MQCPLETVSVRQGRFPSMVPGTQGMHKGAWNPPRESAGTKAWTPASVERVDEGTRGTNRRPIVTHQSASHSTHPLTTSHPWTSPHHFIVGLPSSSSP